MKKADIRRKIVRGASDAVRIETAAAADANHEKFESAFWGSCANTWHEELKQFVYAKYIGLTVSYYKDPVFQQIGRAGFNLHGHSVLDIGGGPVSMLLKSYNFKRAVVVDPTRYPEWVYFRYDTARIESLQRRGEDIDLESRIIDLESQASNRQFDEAWIYNVLQHSDDPEKIIRNARKASRTLRLFEWIDIPAHEGHPHMLTADKLRAWLDAPGSVVELNEQGCVGRAFYGVFAS